MPKPKISALQKRINNPYSAYWEIRAMEAMETVGTKMECAICGTLPRGTLDQEEHGTCFHHLLAKGRHALHRLSPMCVFPVCASHHGFGKVGAHSEDCLSTWRFGEAVRSIAPAQWQWLQQHEDEKKTPKDKINFKWLFERWSSINRAIDSESILTPEDTAFLEGTNWFRPTVGGLERSRFVRTNAKDVSVVETRGSTTVATDPTPRAGGSAG
jgi:hypothetical protein